MVINLISFCLQDLVHVGWDARAQASFKQLTLLGQKKIADFVESVRQA